MVKGKLDVQAEQKLDVRLVEAVAKWAEVYPGCKIVLATDVMDVTEDMAGCEQAYGSEEYERMLGLRLVVLLLPIAHFLPSIKYHCKLISARL